MALNLIQKATISAVLSIVLLGCCTPQQPIEPAPKVTPLWVTKIIGDKTQYIYNNGLKTAPIYKNSIIFSTTLTSNIEMEDNRLCGMDLETGKVNWMFPADKNQPSYYYFDSEGYIGGKYLIARSNYSHNSPEKILCVDLDNNTLAWEQEYPTAGTYQGIVGKDNDAYFALHTTGEATINHIEIPSSNITTIYSIKKKNCSIGRNIMIDDDLLRFFVYYTDSGKTKGELISVDIKSKAVVSQNEIELYVRGKSHFGVSCSELIDDKIYYTSGETLVCVDAHTAQVLWKYENASRDLSNSMAIFDDCIILYGYGAFIGIDRHTGRQLYRNARGMLWVINDGRYLYMRASGGAILVVEPKDGRVVSELSCPAEVGYEDDFSIQQGRVHNGKLYIGSWSSIYCYPAYPWQ